MSERFEIRLPSGRFVRYRTLTTTEIESNEKAAAADSTAETKVVEYNTKVERTGLAMMVTEYTERQAGKPDARPGPSAWKKPSGNELTMQWDAVFSAKDSAVLKSIYRSEHVASPSELDAIMAGKVQILEE